MIANPFSTRFTQPGAMPFRYPAQTSRTTILKRLEQSHWIGQVRGPHGSGKTTLCRDLEPDLLQRFSSIRYLTVRRDSACGVNIHESRKRSRSCGAPSDHVTSELIVIDGAELLSPVMRFSLLKNCRDSQSGLVATVHRRLRWLPDLVCLEPTVDLFVELANDLMSNSACHEARISRAEFENAFVSSACNVREALMKSFDRFEEFASEEFAGLIQ